jgi:hypothetical protein
MQLAFGAHIKKLLDPISQDVLAAAMWLHVGHCGSCAAKRSDSAAYLNR